MAECQHNTSVIIDPDSWEQDHRCLDCGAVFSPFEQAEK